MESNARSAVERITSERVNQYYQRVRQITDDLLYCFDDFPLTYDKVERVIRQAREQADKEFSAWSSLDLNLAGY
jgi:hypothetical protein